MIVSNDILEELKNQDYRRIKTKIESLLKKEIKQRGSKGVVIGLSGGIDSAVLALLCAKILKNNVLALIMPDSKITPKQDTEDGIALAKQFGIKYKIININEISESFQKNLPANRLALGNLKARIRTNVIYYYSNILNYLVLGSSDKSEHLIGYFTKYGDGACDLMPIVSLYKTQIREFAKFLEIPKKIILKKSGAHLWKNHYAESELGITYEEIDSILYCFVDLKKSLHEVVKITGINRRIVSKVLQLQKNSQHKREPPRNLLKTNQILL